MQILWIERLLQGNGERKAVSYTHLDVYKRQVFSIAILMEKHNGKITDYVTGYFHTQKC